MMKHLVNKKASGTSFTVIYECFTYAFICSKFYYMFHLIPTNLINLRVGLFKVTFKVTDMLKDHKVE